MHPFLKRLFRLGKLRTALVLLAMAVLLSNMPAQAQPNDSRPNDSRRITPSETSAQIYQQHPDFPLENQYISSETGTPDIENTLVSRLIRYHVYLKRRDTSLRLTWKLTMADYLGAFDRIRAERYLDSGLTSNPLAGDVAAIEALSIEDRDRLVNALYETFTGRTSAAPPDATSAAPIQ